MHKRSIGNSSRETAFTARITAPPHGQQDPEIEVFAKLEVKSRVQLRRNTSTV